ncbi:hypothetical protein GIB67_027500 [Kingdonia uniflora]|uniref:Uncharacterized protein n=1 Tax=Kingdonia uniflora TaxID=39325 RepID=A0A7J7MFE8_9MAGN|nr:hypothetical protein GIB67_027500 [Kingdonia uniflora]
MSSSSSDSSIGDPPGLSSSSSSDDLIFNCAVGICILHEAAMNIVVHDATSSHSGSVMGRDSSISWRLVLVVVVAPAVAAAGLDYDTRARVQSMCAGTFDEKTDTEAWTFLNDVADKTYQWQTMREEIPSHRANVHQVDSNSESATLRTILEKIENLETGKRERHPNTSSVNHVVMPNCVVCESSDHLVQDCPDVVSLREGRKDQANAMYQRPNNQPFNGGWNNNSNNSNSRGNRNYQGGSSGSAPYQPHNQVNQHQSSSSWQQNPSYQAPLNVPYVPPHNRNLPPPTTSLEDTLKAFMQVTQSSIAKLEGQIGQMATEISTRDKGTFPSQTQANPKGNTEHPRSSNRDGVNAIISLRSGTKVDNLVKMPKEPELEIQSSQLMARVIDMLIFQEYMICQDF